MILIRALKKKPSVLIGECGVAFLPHKKLFQTDRLTVRPTNRQTLRMLHFQKTSLRIQVVRKEGMGDDTDVENRSIPFELF